jgi:hypothetical protein
MELNTNRLLFSLLWFLPPLGAIYTFTAGLVTLPVDKLTSLFTIPSVVTSCTLLLCFVIATVTATHGTKIQSE